MTKLFRFLKPYRYQIALVLIFVFGQTMAELYLPTLMSDIVDNGIVKGDIGYIWQIGGIMLLVALGGDRLLDPGRFPLRQDGDGLRQDPARQGLPPRRALFAARVRQDRHAVPDHADTPTTSPRCRWSR